MIKHLKAVSTNTTLSFITNFISRILPEIINHRNHLKHYRSTVKIFKECFDTLYIDVYFSENLKEKKYRKIAEGIRNVNIIKTEKLFRGEPLSIGMLVKNVEDYEYFKTYFENNRLQLEECMSEQSNYKSTEFELYNSFSPDTELFY